MNNPTPAPGSRCRACGRPVRPLWTLCEGCRKRLAVEDRIGALEELSWRVEIEENKRR